MKKQPEITALTRKNLIDTYFKLRADGQKITVGAVSELAGYNRCTFYRYFTDTDQLLHEVENEICNAFTEALSKETAIEKPTEMIGTLVGIYQQYGDYLSVLLGRYGDLRFVDKMKSVIQPIASQLFTASTDSSAVVALKTEFVMSAVLATVTKWYDMKQPIEISQLGLEIKNLLQSGIAIQP